MLIHSGSRVMTCVSQWEEGKFQTMGGLRVRREVRTMGTVAVTPNMC